MGLTKHVCVLSPMVTMSMLHFFHVQHTFLFNMVQEYPEFTNVMQSLPCILISIVGSAKFASWLGKKPALTCHPLDLFPKMGYVPYFIAGITTNKKLSASAKQTFIVFGEVVKDIASMTNYVIRTSREVVVCSFGVSLTLMLQPSFRLGFRLSLSLEHEQISVRLVNTSIREEARRRHFTQFGNPMTKVHDKTWLLIPLNNTASTSSSDKYTSTDSPGQRRRSENCSYATNPSVVNAV